MNLVSPSTASPVPAAEAILAASAHIGQHTTGSVGLVEYIEKEHEYLGE